MYILCTHPWPWTDFVYVRVNRFSWTSIRKFQPASDWANIYMLNHAPVNKPAIFCTLFIVYFKKSERKQWAKPHMLCMYHSNIVLIRGSRPCRARAHVCLRDSFGSYFPGCTAPPVLPRTHALKHTQKACTGPGCTNEAACRQLP